MALQASGAISLSEIRGEFGGSAPDSISEYYGADTGVPASGTISFSDFYGTSAAPTETSQASSTHTGTFTGINDGLTFDELGMRTRTSSTGTSQTTQAGWLWVQAQNKYYPAIQGTRASIYNTNSSYDGKFQVVLNGNNFITWTAGDHRGNWSERNVNGTDYTILTVEKAGFQSISSSDTWKFEWFNLS